jgi:hypothetical protein
MVARIWHGRTLTSKGDAYLAFLQRRALPDYRSTPGNSAAFILRRIDGEVTHFTALTHWDSIESIEAFAGVDIARAKYYPEDEDFLLEFEPKVQHWEIHS